MVKRKGFPIRESACCMTSSLMRLLSLKNLCKASHKAYYDKYFVMRSYSKCMFDYQNVTALLLVSALHNNMAAMTLFHLNVRTNGHQKVPF